MKKILIVEDEEQMQQIYKEVLTAAGFEVIPVTTGKEALEKLKTLHPDLILLDIMLPEGMNGFDVLEALKRDLSLAPIPVIVLTNLDSEKESALAVGAVDYILKAETSLDDLVAKVKKHLQPPASN